MIYFSTTIFPLRLLTTVNLKVFLGLISSSTRHSCQILDLEIIRTFQINGPIGKVNTMTDSSTAVDYAIGG